MKIMALNCGSSSIKYQLFDTDSEYNVILAGIVERIGQADSQLRQKCICGKEVFLKENFRDHASSLRALYNKMFNKNCCAVIKPEDIDSVGHRIVHGGENFRQPKVINDEVMSAIGHAAEFAPLHSHPNIIGIEISREILSDAKHVAVFDTAVHQAIPPKAYLYGLPIEYYEKYGIRKYGFHGINHSYVSMRAAEIMCKPLEKLKLITCHLGSGSSITAFDKGQSVDTSMGLTPLEGVMMGTRCGDIDASAVLYMIERLELEPSKVKELLNCKSGLKGLCGRNDMRDIIELASKGDRHAQTAIDVFVYRVQKYIGGYITALNGVDGIVFTGGIGENSPYIRELIMQNFTYLGALVDISKNDKNEKLFSDVKSKIKLMNIKANEELIIAKETFESIQVVSQSESLPGHTKS